MNPFIERTEDHLYTTWADINWHAVEENVRRLQERIYRATTNKAWRKVKNLQKLLVRATSNQLLAIRRITQENQGKHTAGIDGMVYDTPKARWKLFQEGLSLQGYKPRPVRRVYIPKDNGKQRPLGIPTGKDRGMQAIVKAALEPEWEARFEGNSYGFRPGRCTMDAVSAIHTTMNRKDCSPWVLDADISGCFDNIDHGPLLAKLPVFTTTLRQWLKAGVVEVGFFSPTDTGTPQGGVLTPPTKLPTFFFGVRIVRVRIDPKHDIDLIPGDFHPLHQGPDAIPLARPVGCLQSAVDFGRKIFESANNQLECRLQGRLIRPRLTLLFQASEALTEAGNPGLELVLVDAALRIAVKQPGDAVPELADLRFPRGQGRACGPRLRL